MLSTPEVIVKPWGRTAKVYHDNRVEVWHASIYNGGFSSKHRHLTKVNEFYVVLGTLLVHLYVSEKADVPYTVYTVNKGDVFRVVSGEWHRFEALTEVELIETYYLNDIGEDIVRRDCGGKK